MSSADSTPSATRAESHGATPDSRATEREWVRRWGEIREWRIIVLLVVPLAPVFGILVGGWSGWFIALGAPLGALARLYGLRCPNCAERFAKGRLTPMPSSCAVCGSAVFDNEVVTQPEPPPSATTPSEPLTMSAPRTRSIARWGLLRKQIAAVQIAASAFGIVTLLDVATQTGDNAVSLVSAAILLVLAGIAGFLLWRDRTGGVPLSLCYYALQVVLFHVDSARLWIVLGPYAFVIVGAGGPSASAGFTYGFANVPGVGRAPNWVGVNLLAVAAFWFLWRRPWRETSAPSAHESVALLATPLIRE